MEQTLNEQEQGKVGPKRHRSPGYPNITLDRALEYTNKLFLKNGRYPTLFPAVAEAWNYSIKSSGLLQTLAALSYFGLVEVEGSGNARRIKLSDLAFKIIGDKRPVSPERDNFITQAALKPSVFKMIAESYRDGLPDDINLQHELVMNYKFTHESAKDCIAIIKKTFNYAKIYESGILKEAEGDNAEADLADEENTEQITPPANKGNEGKKPPAREENKMGEFDIAKILISKQAQLRVIGTGAITQKNIDKLITILNILKEGYPADDAAAEPNG